MSRRVLASIFGCVAILAVSAGALAAAKPGAYAGTTSEKGTVAFAVSPNGKTITGFTTSDGYNGKCHFKGGVGGLGNYTVKVTRMTLAENGSFTATTKAKIGPFSGTFRVTGKLTGGSAKGTVNKVGAGATCGTGSSNPSTQLYLESFTAKRG